MPKPSAARLLGIALATLLVLTAFGVAAAADAPTSMTFTQVFNDTNPCTGLTQTITVTGTMHVHEHDGSVVVHAERSISTSAGFEGRGSSTFVMNGEVQRLSLRDVLVHESGARMRAGFIFVLDLASDTVKAFHGGVICIRP